MKKIYFIFNKSVLPAVKHAASLMAKENGWYMPDEKNTSFYHLLKEHCFHGTLGCATFTNYFKRGAIPLRRLCLVCNFLHFPAYFFLIRLNGEQSNPEPDYSAYDRDGFREIYDRLPAFWDDVARFCTEEEQKSIPHIRNEGKGLADDILLTHLLEVIQRHPDDFRLSVYLQDSNVPLSGEVTQEQIYAVTKRMDKLENHMNNGLAELYQDEQKGLEMNQRITRLETERQGDVLNWQKAQKLEKEAQQKEARRKANHEKYLKRKMKKSE